jgi:pyruvate/2-oxoglutarate dehydrogenase complex dihydrolipoamide dehydrogenase (E3) component/uncharacterized membrane protein YdjX (TVP38/TMEM64 family)
LSLPAAAILTVAGGALFGLLEGLALVSFASTLGATLAMLLSRYLLRDWVQQRFGTRMAGINQGLEREGAFYLFALRLVPVFPFFLVNLAMGLTKLPARTFFWVSQLGMLPGTIAFVYAGTQLAKIDSLKGLLSPGLLAAFAVLGLLPLITKKVLDALRARKVYQRWKRPKSFDYNLVAIGAGSAGLVTTYIGAAVKAKVALIERHKMGGDCLNTGCVPSKALIRTAKLLHEARNSEKYGVRALAPEFYFAQAMERVQQVIAKVEPHDSVERYSGLGVECISGEARLLDPWTIAVGDRKLTARNIVIATGARPTVPKLPGIEDVDYLTSDTVWNIRVQPKRLLVLGGGPIGCELGQCFARLGCTVTIVQRNVRLLPKEDPDASALLKEALEHEGVQLALGAEALRVEKDGAGGRLVVRQNGAERAIAFDRLLLALGRTANVTGFGLEELGVVVGEHGTLDADPLMRTNLPNISVCGDVTGPFQFTHVAAHQAWYAAVNSLFGPFWTFKADYRVIPWATFTDPEVARVGLSETEAKAQDIAYEISHYGLDDLDRAIADSSDHGYVKVLTVPGKDSILGATIVGAHAGDLLAEYVLAMRHGLGLKKILGTIHSYPTMMEANKYAAGIWAKAHAPARALKWLEKFHAWRRR